MDLRDYLLVLRRGWPTIIAFALLGVALAGAYLVATPKTYQASTTVLIAPSDPTTIAENQAGTQLAGLVAPTYAGLMASTSVLDDVGSRLRPQAVAGDLAGSVVAAQRSDTSLIEILASADSPARAQEIANLVAERSAVMIPQMLGSNPRAASLTITQTVPAALPSQPTSPATRSVLAIGLLVGIAAGIGTAIARYALDTSIRTLQDIHRAGGRALLGSVPAARRTDLPPAADPASRLAERYRSLRTAVGFGRLDTRRTVLVAPVQVTREGHLVAANLAVSVARTSRSVLLVDADLHGSPMTETFRLRSRSGLADVLAGRVGLDEALVMPAAGLSLTVLTAGKELASASDLLSSPAMHDLVAHLSASYDTVIFNAPPVLSYTDASVLATEVQATMLVLRQGRTKAVALVGAATALAGLGVEVIGCVFMERRLAHIFGGTQDPRSRYAGDAGRRSFRPALSARRSAALSRPEPRPGTPSEAERSGVRRRSGG